jgi:hypothetical protein
MDHVGVWEMGWGGGGSSVASVHLKLNGSQQETAAGVPSSVDSSWRTLTSRQQME